jgi:hypothetical protein
MLKQRRLTIEEAQKGLVIFETIPIQCAKSEIVAIIRKGRERIRTRRAV